MQNYANLVELLKNAVKRIFSCKNRFDTAENEPAKKLQISGQQLLILLIY